MSRMMSVPVYDVCGIDIAAVSPPRAAAVLVAAAQQPGSVQVHLCNAYTLSLVEQDQELRSALHCADLNLPDGAPVAWLGWRRGAGRSAKSFWLVMRCFGGWGAGLGCSGAGVGCF